MGRFPSPCLAEGCPRLAPPGESRCPTHSRAKEQARVAHRRGKDTVRRRVRAALDRAGSGQCGRCGVGGYARFLEVHHTTPLVDGGADVLENIQVVCKPCHRKATTAEAAARRARRPV